MRILHFSDVHLVPPAAVFFTAEFLRFKRLVAFVNLVVRRRRHFRQTQAKLAQLAEFVRQNQVDYLLCAGDLTTMGLLGEFRQAHDAVVDVFKQGKGYLLVPGNHDLYLHARGEQHAFDLVFSDHMASDLPDFVSPTGFPLVRFMGEHAVAVAINTAKPNPLIWRSSGRIRQVEVDALSQLLEHHSLRGKRVFLLTHYPLDEPGGLHGFENAQDLINVIGPRENLVYLHGHNHMTYRRKVPGLVPELFCAGSLTRHQKEGFWLFDSTARLACAQGYWAHGRFALRDFQNAL